MQNNFNLNKKLLALFTLFSSTKLSSATPIKTQKHRTLAHRKQRDRRRLHQEQIAIPQEFIQARRWFGTDMIIPEENYQQVNRYLENKYGEIEKVTKKNTLKGIIHGALATCIATASISSLYTIWSNYGSEHK